MEHCRTCESYKIEDKMVAFKQSGYFSHLTSLVRSLISRPPPFLPSVCVHNNAQGRLEWKVKTGEAWETL